MSVDLKLEVSKGRLPVGMVQRIERLVGGDPMTEDQVLRFIGARYGARSLIYLPPHVAAEVVKRPADFVRAAKRFTQPELDFEAMGKAEKEWARRKRQELMDALGRVCALCGTTERLEFDCIEPMGDEHHRFDTSHRMSFYRRQHAAGNLQVLCTSCNARKGARECYPVPCDGREVAPF